MNSRRITAFRALVVKYWKKNGRHALPWRKTKDPYHILVSEVMLQQTQVERVIPFYEKFLQRFPSARDLAAAQLSEVLRLWSGLGYNRRAKFLHLAAKAVIEKHAGIFPKSYEALRALPGIGDYTARAVRAFAFDEPEVFIETNIRTAFTYYFFPEKESVSDGELMPLIAEAAKARSSREWYSALMDYGAHLKRSGVRINAKSAHYAKQSAFEGSLRQVRGAILKAHADKRELRAVEKKFGAKYKTAYDVLKKEGLIQ